MSHDRGCSCGREKYEYDTCQEVGCPKRIIIDSVPNADALQPRRATKVEGIVTLPDGTVIKAHEPTAFEFFGQEFPYDLIGKIIQRDVEYVRSMPISSIVQVYALCKPIMTRMQEAWSIIEELNSQNEGLKS